MLSKIFKKEAEILNVKSIREQYSFLVTKEKKDIYFCNCGNKTIVKTGGKENLIIDNSESIDDEYYAGIIKTIKSGINENVVCGKCKKNYSLPESQETLIPSETYFAGYYKFLDTKKDITLSYTKVKVSQFFLSLKKSEKTKTLTVNKETNELSFIDYDKKKYIFDINEINKFVELFFKIDEKAIVNIVDLHNYITSLFNYVPDSKNLNFINEFLKDSKNNFVDSGIQNMKKIIITSFAIIKYSNLSTIALTKGPKFLYDLLSECDIPDPKIMREQKITAPIPIFNFLAKNYIDNLNKEVSEDRKFHKEFVIRTSQDSQRFTAREYFIQDVEKLLKNINYVVLEPTSIELFKRLGVDYKNIESIKELFKDIEGILNSKLVKKSDKELLISEVYIVNENGTTKSKKIKINNSKSYSENKVKDVSGKLQIMDDISSSSVSKFVYNNIKSFSDYKQIVKYFKFFDKHQIVTLLQKFDLNLLTNMIDMIYFRDGNDMERFEKLAMIIDDFVKIKSEKVYPGKNRKDYNFTKDFDFTHYDDSIMMIEVLKFSKAKHFNKIKDFTTLKKYHDEIVSFYKIAGDSEKNEKFREFVSQFKFLESREDYEGNLKFVLLSTPSSVIKDGNEQKHSGKSYSKRMVDGTYLMGQIFDLTPNLPSTEIVRFTVGFTYDKYRGLVFDQVKGFGNAIGSNRFKELVMEFLTAKEIPFKAEKDLKIN